MRLVNQQNYSPDVDPSIGGKGRELFNLRSIGTNVPAHAVTHVDEYFYFKKNQKFSDEFKFELANFLDQWSDNTYFAVRSSMIGEYGVDASFAGLFETFLFVTKESVLEKIKECYNSINAPRVTQYLKQKKSTQILGSVVIQEMIPSTVSGVAFSRAPVGENSHLLIESSFGLGEGVVSGTVGVDTYRVSRFGDILEKIISTKAHRISAINGTVQMVENEHSKQASRA